MRAGTGIAACRQLGGQGERALQHVLVSKPYVGAWKGPPPAMPSSQSGKVAEQPSIVPARQCHNRTAPIPASPRRPLLPLLPRRRRRLARLCQLCRRLLPQLLQLLFRLLLHCRQLLLCSLGSLCCRGELGFQLGDAPRQPLPAGMKGCRAGCRKWVAAPAGAPGGSYAWRAKSVTEHDVISPADSMGWPWNCTAIKCARHAPHQHGTAWHCRTGSSRHVAWHAAAPACHGGTAHGSPYWRQHGVAQHSAAQQALRSLVCLCIPQLCPHAPRRRLQLSIAPRQLLAFSPAENGIYSGPWGRLLAQHARAVLIATPMRRQQCMCCSSMPQQHSLPLHWHLPCNQPNTRGSTAPSSLQLRQRFILLSQPRFAGPAALAGQRQLRPQPLLVVLRR